jgi:DUF1680 family protein
VTQDQTPAADARLAFAGFEDVQMRDTFWRPILQRNRDVTIPHNLRMCREVGVVANFERAAGLKGGDYVGLPNWDEFLYKSIEAASYGLAQRYNASLDFELDEIIAVIAKAQEPDGYLHTGKQLGLAGRGPDRGPRWSNLRDDLELYYCGHLYEAAVAHHWATGKRTLLDIALKNAAHVLSVFGPGRNHGVPGHEEIELALVRLHEYTGNKLFLQQSRFFIDERGNARRHELYGPFHQDHKPFVEQAVAVGQAPRAAYLYSGATDVALHTGDERYTQALQRLWHDVVFRKLYVNGGIGSSHDNEGFGSSYDLPNLSGYNEICAAISLSMWATRMFRLDTDAKYFDVVERTLYNNLIAGVSYTGDRYFYACPTESDGRFRFNVGWLPEDQHHLRYAKAAATRKEWFPCACCPPNLARYLPQVPGFAYATRGRDVYVNLFAGSEARLTVDGLPVTIVQETRYPWDGRVKLTLKAVEGGRAGARFACRLRIPGWSRDEPVPSDLYRFADDRHAPVTLQINSQPYPVGMEKGYAVLDRTWQSGDVVELDLPMPVRCVVAHPNVSANAGRAALQRGPLLYCFEGVDNGGRVRDLSIADAYAFAPRWRAGFFGGAMLLEGVLQRGTERVRSTAIPYHLWSNRGEGEMVVWLREDEPLA